MGKIDVQHGHIEKALSLVGLTKDYPGVRAVDSVTFEIEPGTGFRRQISTLKRVNRGGSFSFRANFARSAYRSRLVPDYRGRSLGVRPSRVCR